MLSSVSVPLFLKNKNKTAASFTLPCKLQGSDVYYSQFPFSMAGTHDI